MEVKAAEFVSDGAIEELRRTFDIPTVKRLSPVLPVLSRKGMTVPFTTCEELLRKDAGQGTPLWKLAVEYEMSRGGLTESEVLGRMVEIVRILRRSIEQGIAGTHYDDRVLGHQCGQFNDLLQAGRLLDGGAMNRIVLYVSALMEVKSAMGVIVAAPTAGACAALPGAVIAMAEGVGQGEEAMAQAMLASGLIGAFIATRWTFAAEVGGCQAEGGSAASMAAAALVTLADGTLAQAVAAASMALQSMLGLICDPVANRVEVPCLGKNVMAATNALACANMALAGYDPVIPLDEVIETAARVAPRCRASCAARLWAGCRPRRLPWRLKRGCRTRSGLRAGRPVMPVEWPHPCKGRLARSQRRRRPSVRPDCPRRPPTVNPLPAPAVAVGSGLNEVRART